MLYLPILYYPTKRENRATGFLLPTYGSSTHPRAVDSQRVLLGDRPQPGCDGHCTTGFRRPVRASAANTATTWAAADGNIRTYLLEPARHATRGGHGTVAIAASRSYEIRGSANQMLPGNLRARARRRLLLEHRDDADVQHEHLRRLAQPADVRRQRRRRMGHLHAERHVRSQRVLLQRDQSILIGQLAAASRSRGTSGRCSARRSISRSAPSSRICCANSADAASCRPIPA